MFKCPVQGYLAVSRQALCFYELDHGIISNFPYLNCVNLIGVFNLMQDLVSLCVK